jgi:hypothetical protein
MRPSQLVNLGNPTGPASTHAVFLLFRPGACALRGLAFFQRKLFQELSSALLPKAPFFSFPTKPGFVTMCFRHSTSFASPRSRLPGLARPRFVQWRRDLSGSWLLYHDRWISCRFRPIASLSSKAGDSGRLAIVHLKHGQEFGDCQQLAYLLCQA